MQFEVQKSERGRKRRDQERRPGKKELVLHEVRISGSDKDGGLS